MNNDDDVFYGQEEEGFEELVEKNLVNKDFGLDNENLLSDLESDRENDSGSEMKDDVEDFEDKELIKRESRLSSVMNMTRNPLASMTNNLRKDEEKIQRNISMLSSALGGFDPNPPNSYILGMEALGCLKDIKQLLKQVDEEKHVLNVASACHDSGLFINDLIPIMVQFGGHGTANTDPEIMKILLVTLEIIVRLMTPMKLENDDDNDQDKLFTKLRRAQIEYKHRLLHYKKGKIFKILINLMLPILELEKKDMTRRDKIILNLCLTLFNNVLRIQPSDAKVAKKNRSNIVHVFQALPNGISENDISLDVVFQIFKKYHVLSVIQTIASNLSKEFDTEILGTSCLDFYYYTFLFVDPTELAEDTNTMLSKTQQLAQNLRLSDAPSESQNNENTLSATNSKLLLLQEEEHDNLRKFKSRSSTRHAHFGSLINIQDNKNTNRVFSGQDKLFNNDLLSVLDSNASKTLSGKHINRQKSGLTDQPEKFAKLNRDTRKLVNKFVNDFRENGFHIMFKEINNILINRDTSDDFTFHYHYFFVINWMLNYEKSFQSHKQKSISNLERFKYLFCCFEGRSLKMMMNRTIPHFLEIKNYECLNITISIFKEILNLLLMIHSYQKFNDTRLLSEDKLLLKGLVSRAEGSLRLIFEVDSEITTLLRYPQNAHKKGSSIALGMIEFTNVLFKTINYIARLDPPIMLSNKNREDFNENNEFIGDMEGLTNNRRVIKLKKLDINLCDKFKTILFSDHTVSTHIWLFLQYNEIDEKKLGYCLSYFSKLLEDWKSNILKLVRLDFMYALHELKTANISDKLKSEFGMLLNYFMHHFTKLSLTNSKYLLLEPMSFNEMTDLEIRQYYISGDPFSGGLNQKEQKKADFHGNKDISFADAHISDNEKIALIVSYLFYKDKIHIVESLVQFLSQWYLELTHAITPSTELIGKLGSYRLQGLIFKEYNMDPYFRELCKIGGILNGVLLGRDSNKLLSYKQSIDIAINTPLNDEDLENKFIDPNYLDKQKRKLYKRSMGEDSDSDSDGHHGYGSEGIDDGTDDERGNDDDLAGSESDAPMDELEMLEATLKNSENRVKGKAMKRTADGKLVAMGKKRKEKKHKSKNDKLRNKKKLRKRRKIVKDDDEVLSDTEILRRAHLSKDRIEDSDEDMDDGVFFEREMKLQELLQKRHGQITKQQYDSLMNNTLDLENVSDLDEYLVGDQNTQLGPQTAALNKPDTDSLMKLLKGTQNQSEEEGSEGDSESNSDNDVENDSDNEKSDDSDNNEVDNNNDDESENDSDDSSSVSSDDDENMDDSDDETLGISKRKPTNIISDDEDLSDEADSSEDDIVKETNDDMEDIVESSENNEATDEADSDKIQLSESTEPAEIDIFASLKQVHDLINSNTTE